MKTQCVVFLFAFFFFHLGAQAGESDSWGDIMTYFYKEPSQEKFLELQKNAEQDEKVKSDSHIQNIFVVAMAKINEKFGWPYWEKRRFKEEAMAVRAGTSRLAWLVNKNKGSYLYDPDRMDYLWVSFFSTGDKKYLNALLHYLDPGFFFFVRGILFPRHFWLYQANTDAVRLSFRSNWRQHDFIKKFVENKLSETAALPYYQNIYLQELVSGGVE